ncbi:hypothetical protein ACH79_16530 [Bradyrhizobium sp. CCBAU 051011]|uniref:DUF1254 domain-containing protein n=1 Tax=Bradyrhizobium sp. CCBAU 051011 TaxID=858422 RepID=UPI001373FBEE|nr:DUF1254 domain-containing protein [Bradyrhizobium sp. CCBAU 051011]QHO78864.1 hypothetical protein ACH79_16530 [Bradyrhizobium sp. CCBAU 051011]
MKLGHRTLPAFAIIYAAALFGGGGAVAQATIPPSLVTPDKVESRIGTLEFKDGLPSKATLERVYDNLDFSNAFRAVTDTMQGPNIEAIRKGFHDFGAKDNEVVVWSELLDAKSLMLTGNADTVYVFAILDLSKGPMVLEVGPNILGAIDDHWSRWITDVGLPGPDRGQGGKYLIVPPDYKGELPEGGFYVVRSRTYINWWFGRAFIANKNDPKPAAESIRKFTKIYPYEPGGVGTPISEFLAGKAKLGRIASPPPTVFHEGSGKAMNTVPPNDWSYFEMLNTVVQTEPATSLDPELMGPLAAIGIIKGKEFKPDERMKKIMTDALAVGNATARSLTMNARDKSWFYYPDSAWLNPLFVTGHEFETPIPEVTPEGAKPFPPTGYRQMDARTSFFYSYIGITPGMAMRLTGIGSQYLIATVDANKTYFDGAKTYKVTLPKDIPEANFWSFTVYDVMTRSFLDTPQRYPRAGSQSYPSPAAEPNADGSTTIYFGPTQPAGVKRGNWIQTMPGKGWWTILRLYSPLEPFFAKTWRPSEIELVRQ